MTTTTELTDGTVVYNSPVPYKISQSLEQSRFPEKVYRHQVLGTIPKSPSA